MTTADRDDVARASTTIDAPNPRVWSALVDPEQIARWMVGTTVDTDWREGSTITWKGEWQGTAYEDKGTVLQVEEGRLLAVDARHAHAAGGGSARRLMHAGAGRNVSPSCGRPRSPRDRRPGRGHRRRDRTAGTASRPVAPVRVRVRRSAGV